MDAYFTDLAERLRARGVTEERVTVTLTELHDHLLDADSTPEAEFGPVAEFAEQLARGAGASAPEAAGEPGSRAQEWRWTADIYTDRELLNRYGDQGWEVERVDRLGRFVCRRDPGNAMRWEYRRESALRGEHDELAARLAPDGWEPCGRWTYLAYFKRPRAATAGPAARLAAAPEVPERRVFLSRKYRALLVAVLALVVAEAVFLGSSDTSLGDPATLAGMVVGALAGGVGAAYGLRRHLRKERSAVRP
ncbi:hypothetical protein V1L54_09230 [Streptomyces sp. TRM 70361]|uniref:hypothetical protein n=1 Tax=Streptomyces sp. TRM 70361 TaxID=3116553 RepID=UPI002E7B98F4|nr:hypothetical protein [Streptomyces sp. TRM 70361]MEE1939596.1 hypothetical protein [Streptomyces sp. TRM 70361]